MMLPANVLLSVLLLFCSILQTSSASSSKPTKKKDFYSSVVEAICRESGSLKTGCKSCLSPLISKQMLRTTEIQKSKLTELKTCMEKIPETFKKFRCDLERNGSYYMRDFVNTSCLEKLQSLTPFIDLEKAELSNLKSNPGYYGLNELTGLALAGIIKYSKELNAGSQDFCSSFQESGFLTALSQAHGKSWESNFETKTTLFFDAVHKFICKSEDCYQCLQRYLTAETISEKEIDSKTFNGILKCKGLVLINKEYKTFKKALSEMKFSDRIPSSCLDDLKLKEKSFKYDANVNITDLKKNTFFLQEALKLGVATVFFYFNKNENQISDDMKSGLCETVVRRYVKSFLYAMPSLHKDGQFTEDHPEYPYKKLINRTCEDSKICEACYRKLTSLIDIKRPKEVSVDDMQVLDHCNGYQSEDFKSFVADFDDTTFKTCMKKDDAYTILVRDYPMDQEADIVSSPALLHFSNFKTYLEFLFKGVCYYYKEVKETDVTLAEELHKLDVPGAFLFAIPATNEWDTRECQQEE